MGFPSATRTRRTARSEKFDPAPLPDSPREGDDRARERQGGQDEGLDEAKAFHARATVRDPPGRGRAVARRLAEQRRRGCGKSLACPSRTPP